VEARIFLIDDHEAYRSGLKEHLSKAHPEWIVDEAADGDSALAALNQLKPDLVITDLVHPGPDGVEIARFVTQNMPQVRVLLLTVFASARTLRQSRDSGAHGYLMKSEPPRKIVRAIERILQGQSLFPKPFVPSVKPVGLLTGRETEILCRLARGMSNREIAADLNIRAATIETHRTSVMRKLGVHSVQDMMRWAVENKLPGS
jgi:DNA-binding NarL/FixJ family response regulator